MCLAVYALVTFLVFFAVWRITETDPYFLWVEDIVSAGEPWHLLVLLSTFAGMAIGPMLAVRLLHRRRAGTLFGPAAQTLRDFAVATVTAFAVLGLTLVGWFIFNDPLPGLAPGVWLLLLPLALLGIALQTGAEELVFRGYLQQQLGARFRSPLLWAAFPALLFGAVHFDPASAGENVWLVVGAAAFFGLVAADLTARTGSIGAAWGFHFANNTVALTLIATQGTLTGLALFQTPYDVADTTAMRASIPVDLAVMVVIWLLLRRILAR